VNEVTSPSLAFELIGALQSVVGRLEDALEPLGLSLPKLRLLTKLANAGEPVPLRTLAEYSACVRSNITQLMDRLEAEKLVVRVADPQDRRSVRAELTAEGRKRHAAGLRVLRQAERELASRLPERDRESLLRVLGSLRESC
jgi:MarR family 2-MHQ and catechol resistance regulon transcriptional repressor